MTYSLSNNCTKNYYNRTLTVQVIVEDVVTWIFLKHSVYTHTQCTARGPSLSQTTKGSWMHLGGRVANAKPLVSPLTQIPPLLSGKLTTEI